MRKQGYKIDDLTADVLLSLRESQFRPGTLDQGRGPGMIEVMGKEGLNAFIEWAEGSRGTLQAAADIILYAVLGNTDEGKLVLARLNRRVWRSYRYKYRNDPAKLAQVNQVFADFKVPSSVLAGVPTGKFESIYRKLTGLKN